MKKGIAGASVVTIRSRSTPLARKVRANTRRSSCTNCTVSTKAIATARLARRSARSRGATGPMQRRHSSLDPGRFGIDGHEIASAVWLTVVKCLLSVL